METKFLVDPILRLFKSKRFIVFVISLVLNVLIVKFPELGTFREELMTIVSGLALTLIAGYSLEDAVLAYKTEKPNIPATQEDLVRGIVDETLKEVIK